VTSPEPRPHLLQRLTCPFPPAFASALLRVFLIATCLGWIAAAAGACPPGEKKHEQPYALIFGTVWGPDDHPVYGVKVRIRRESESKARWEIYSDHNGEFAQRVPAGREDYVISADLKGYKWLDGRQLQATDVKVHVENDERVDTGLHLK
jgi:hypothetical protein